MKSKASKKSTKSNQLNMKKPPSKINSKNPSKKPSKLNKDQISRTSKLAPSKKSKKLLSTGEQEVSLRINLKYQI